VESPIGNGSESPNELWTKTLRAIGRDYKLCELCSYPGGKATWGHAVCSKDYGNCLILLFVQRSHCTRSFGDHQTRLEASGFG
jgi:hypothetical protein